MHCRISSFGTLRGLLWVCLMAAAPIILAACNQQGGGTY